VEAGAESKPADVVAVDVHEVKVPVERVGSVGGERDLSAVGRDGGVVIGQVDPVLLVVEDDGLKARELADAGAVGGPQHEAAEPAGAEIDRAGEGDERVVAGQETTFFQDVKARSVARAARRFPTAACLEGASQSPY